MEPICAASPPAMDPSVWSKTPDHLLERILAFLCVEDLLRMRTVCKNWRRDILQVSSFRALHKEVSSPQHPWFITSTSKRRFLAYDAHTSKWNALFVPELPGNLPDPDLKALASSHGLLCFGFRWGELTSTEHLYVCNPITREFRRLPPHPEKTVDHFGMHYSPATNSYKILTINGAERTVTLFDSTSQLWIPGTPPHTNLHLSRSPMAWCGDRVFFMDRIQPWSELHSYNVTLSSWHSLKATSPQVFDSPSLVSCNDRLFMIGLHNIWEVVHRPAASFEFALFDDTLSAQLPKELTEKKMVGRRANVNQFRLNAVASGRFVWLSSSLDHTWVLVYDTEGRRFHKSPKYTHAVHLSEFVDLSFHPCLHATP